MQINDIILEKSKALNLSEKIDEKFITEFMNTTGSIQKFLIVKLAKEIKKRKKLKKIKKDINQTENGRKSFLELFKYLKSDIPDEYVFSVLSEILCKSLESDEELDFDPFQFILIIKKLSENDIKVLFANYKLYTEYIDNEVTPSLKIEDWKNFIAENSGLKYGEIVLNSEKTLTDLNLIAGRINNEEFANTNWFRLTKLSINLCEYLEDFIKNQK